MYTMPNQPLRRSQRIAAMAKKEEEAEDRTKHVVTQSDTATYSSSRCRSSRSRSRSRSRTKRRCSLQSLEDKTTLPTRQSPRRAKSQQKTTKKKRGKGTLKSKKTNATSHVDSTSDETSSTMAPAVKSSQGKSTTEVTPIAAVVKSKGVKFNLDRNSIAQYIKENPPNIVEHLTDEVVSVSEDLFPTDDDDDETTRRNEELLAEWETNFDDLDTCQISRRTARRVSMSY